jgi:hypothetical protein
MEHSLSSSPTGVVLSSHSHPQDTNTPSSSLPGLTLNPQAFLVLDDEVLLGLLQLL